MSLVGILLKKKKTNSLFLGLSSICYPVKCIYIHNVIEKTYCIYSLIYLHIYALLRTSYNF